VSVISFFEEPPGPQLQGRFRRQLKASRPVDRLESSLHAQNVGTQNVLLKCFDNGITK